MAVCSRVSDPRLHAEQVTDGHASIRGVPAELGNIRDDAVVEAANGAALESKPQQGGGDGLGHREGTRPGLGSVALGITLIENGVVAYDDERANVASSQVLGERPHLKIDVADAERVEVLPR